MAKGKKASIKVKGLAVTIISESQDNYSSITHIAHHRDSERSDYNLQNWLCNRSTIEFIGLWGQLPNSNLKPIEFDGVKNMSRANSFALVPKSWTKAIYARGIVSKTVRYAVAEFKSHFTAFEKMGELSLILNIRAI